jgi:hypothetical protein
MIVRRGKTNFRKIRWLERIILLKSQGYSIINSLPAGSLPVFRSGTRTCKISDRRSGSVSPAKRFVTFPFFELLRPWHPAGKEKRYIIYISESKNMFYLSRSCATFSHTHDILFLFSGTGVHRKRKMQCSQL